MIIQIFIKICVMGLRDIQKKENRQEINVYAAKLKTHDKRLFPRRKAAVISH